MTIKDTVAPLNSYKSASKTGVGTLFVSIKTSRVLLNLRAPHKTYPVSWALWGGMAEGNEQPKAALVRELIEEMGSVPDIKKIYPFDVYQSRDGHFKYYSFLALVDDEFIPDLNYESCGYCWIDLGQWPQPMHRGAKISFCNQNAIDRIRSTLAENI